MSSRNVTSSGRPLWMILMMKIRWILILFIGSCCVLTPSCHALTYEKYRKLCKGQPMITRRHEKALQWLEKNVGEGSLVMSTSPQHEAACWILQEGNFRPQRYALGVLFYATTGIKWEANAHWMTHKHECSWYGVQCDSFRKVIGLDLGFIKVDGLIPREMGLLTNLRDLDLHGNDLQGVIPHKMMAGLKKLEYLRLHMNGMFGAIHKEITLMKNLKELHLFGNYMGGTIPKEMAQVKKLGKSVNVVAMGFQIWKKGNSFLHCLLFLKKDFFLTIANGDWRLYILRPPPPL